MKAMKKLIPAICLLLISAVLLGTSTYAWFSMNTKVEATGMKVQATSAKNLVISNTSQLKQNEGSKIASSYSAAVTLVPASTKTLAGSQNFYYVSDSTGVDYANGSGNIGTTFAQASPKTDNNSTSGEVVKHTFYIRVDGQNADTLANLYVSGITVKRADTNSNVTKALRVGVVCGDKGFIYAPLAELAEGKKCEYDAITGAGKVTALDDATGYYKVGDTIIQEKIEALTAYTNASVLASEISSTEYTTVDIYIWYEGEDPNCTSVNSITVEQIEVIVEFTAA